MVKKVRNRETYHGRTAYGNFGVSVNEEIILKGCRTLEDRISQRKEYGRRQRTTSVQKTSLTTRPASLPHREQDLRHIRGTCLPFPGLFL